MKNLLSLFTLAFLLNVGVNAQDRLGFRAEMVQRMKVEKISFIAEQINLTHEEAQDFWPVYNEFEQKRHQIEKSKRNIDEKLSDNQKVLSEDELRKMCDDYTASFDNEARLVKEYNDKFLSILPAQKVIRLYLAEKNFRTHMLQEFRRRQLENKHPGE